MRRIENGQEFLDRELITSEVSGNWNVELEKASDLKVLKVDWLWDKFLPKKKLVLLAGLAGTGKTTISLSIASIVSNGGYFPDGTKAAQGNVVIWTGEDGIEDTLLPRLIAMNANIDNIYFVKKLTTSNKEKNKAFDPSEDMPALKDVINKTENIALLIIDPIVAVVKGDSHKNSEVRNDLDPIVELAEFTNTVVIGITHFSKGTSGKEPIERVTGSLAFGAVARVVLVTSKIVDENGNETRVFVRAKNNLGPDSGGFQYSIEEIDIVNDIKSTKIEWGNAIEGSARELLNDAESNDKATTVEKCAEFLLEFLEDGEKTRKEVSDGCDANGFSQATLRRAKDKLGIKPEKRGFGESGVWIWDLPKKTNNFLRCSGLNVNTLEKNDRLNGLNEIIEGEI